MSMLDEPTLLALLSHDRYAVYLARAGHDPARANRLYVWNISIAAAFWGGFHVLEIAVRNAINARLCQVYGVDRWWEVAPLHPSELRRIESAERSAARTHGPRATSGHVVAELTFGFWVGLLNNRYHQRLWEAGLSAAFPGVMTTRRELQSKLERLRKLRNRIAHHEPVIARDLMLDHVMILEVLETIDPAAKVWVGAHSRVPHLLGCRDDVVDGYWPAAF
jgi:hypothetical protein